MQDNKSKQYHDFFPEDIRSEVLHLAMKLNNNREAVRQIKEKYRFSNFCQRLDERLIHTWRFNAGLKKKRLYMLLKSTVNLYLEFNVNFWLSEKLFLIKISILFYVRILSL